MLRVHRMPINCVYDEDNHNTLKTDHNDTFKEYLLVPVGL